MPLNDRFIVANGLLGQIFGIQEAHALPSYDCPVIPLGGDSPISTRQSALPLGFQMLEDMGAKRFVATLFIDQQADRKPAFVEIEGFHGYRRLGVARGPDAFVLDGGATGQAELQGAIDDIIARSNTYPQYRTLPSKIRERAQVDNHDPARAVRRRYSV